MGFNIRDALPLRRGLTKNALCFWLSRAKTKILCRTTNGKLNHSFLFFWHSVYKGKIGLFCGTVLKCFLQKSVCSWCFSKDKYTGSLLIKSMNYSWTQHFRSVLEPLCFSYRSALWICFCKPVAGGHFSGATIWMRHEPRWLIYGDHISIFVENRYLHSYTLSLLPATRENVSNSPVAGSHEISTEFTRARKGPLRSFF